VIPPLAEDRSPAFAHAIAVPGGPPDHANWGSEAVRSPPSGRSQNGNLKRLHPYVTTELGHYFVLDVALRQGMLPIVWSAKERSTHDEQ